MNEAAYRTILKRLGVEPARKVSSSPEMVGRFLRMPLDRFAVEGCPLEVQVPWLAETLWFVPTEADAQALAEGVNRGRVWTATELNDLMTIPGLTMGQARTIAVAKAEFSGEVVEVRPRQCKLDKETNESRDRG